MQNFSIKLFKKWFYVPQEGSFLLIRLFNAQVKKDFQFYRFKLLLTVIVELFGVLMVSEAQLNVITIRCYYSSITNAIVSQIRIDNGKGGFMVELCNNVVLDCYVNAMHLHTLNTRCKASTSSSALDFLIL